MENEVGVRAAPGPSIEVLDTTLRDGSQREGISFSVEDKRRIAYRLDQFGVSLIEGGWPGSNPKDEEFFAMMKGVPLRQAHLVAFGSTRHPERAAAADPNLQRLLQAETVAVTVFGKAWDLHVTQAIRTTLAENLHMIEESVAFLRRHGVRVIFDAEHFFDGYRRNPAYALDTLRAALAGGADTVVLCDTNGGSLPSQVEAAVLAARAVVVGKLGIHAHNDGGLGVANTLAAVAAGCRHVQGTINGLGERCGNADLCQVLPNLELKMGYRCLPPGQLATLTELSRFVREMANLNPDPHQPWVGSSAFSHKGGIHVSAVLRNPETYEHVPPEVVGNHRKVLISELAGVSNIVFKARELGILPPVEKSPGVSGEEPTGSAVPGSPAQQAAGERPDDGGKVVSAPEQEEWLRSVVAKVKELEHLGYQFEGAEGSFELLLQRTLGRYRPFFELIGFRLVSEKRSARDDVLAEATIKVRVGDRVLHTAADGDGPVNALDNALRKALEEVYPQLRRIKLMDYKVRVLDEKAGTAARVRVLIESADDGHHWGTVGVSSNVIEASWQALVDSIEYGLMKLMVEVGGNQATDSSPGQRASEA